MASQHDAPSLADLTTFRIGGPGDAYVEAGEEAEFVEAICAADRAGEPLLVIGGGSNLLVCDEGFSGVVVRLLPESQFTAPDGGVLRTGAMLSACFPVGPRDGRRRVPQWMRRSVLPRGPRDGLVYVGARACDDWDDLVARTVSRGWAGLEALSGIPGTVGAAPVQNIGAYGAEVADVVHRVRVWDREAGDMRIFTASDLGFGYRTSLLKQTMSLAPPMARSPGAGFGQPKRGAPPAEWTGRADPLAPWFPTPRYVVLDVTLALTVSNLSTPVRYAELASTLGVPIGARAPVAAVREAVLELRSGKGMLLDGVGGAARGDHDRWSAGSFFTNPVLTAAQARELPPDAPRFPVTPSSVAPASGGPGAAGKGAGGADAAGTKAAGPDAVKTSAAWLIEHAGFAKGFGVHGPDSPARLSTRHVLALTNRGSATAQDIVELARVVQDGVRRMYGITLEPEPVLVGLAL
jgi:UDP-N-acetylmuramate dehydrogenase